MGIISINLPEAQAYIAALTGSKDTPVTFQTFGDKNKTDKSLSRVLHGNITKYFSKLIELNEKGAGIFLMVNEGDGSGRTANDIIEVRALFADFDGTPHQEALDLLKPHLIVESSPGKFHLYWLVDDCPLEEFSNIQKAIAKRFNSDPAVHDLPRVMRIPGFMHQKTDKPFKVHIVEYNDLPHYKTDEVIKGLGLYLTESKEVKPHYARTVIKAEDNEFIDYSTGEIFDLKKWVVEYPDFRIAGAIRKHSPDKIIGNLKDDKQHIQCPFNDEHTDQADDQATFCMNGNDSDTDGFVIHCRHAHCAGRDRLDFVKRMLSLKWFPLDALTDKQLLANIKRPAWVHYHLDILNRCPKFNSLSHMEKTIFISYQHYCLTIGGGSFPDNDWQLSRLLGLSEDDWKEYRDVFLQSGLIRSENGRLIHDATLEMYETSQKEYEKKSRGGRRGGKNSSEKRKLKEPYIPPLSTVGVFLTLTLTLLKESLKVTLDRY